jgi:peptidoglycan L-alanyl-D-glutamate endopeptidase CwlK
MDQLTLDRIENLHPKLRAKAREDYIAANNVLGKGCRLRYSYTLRTFAEQDALFLKKPKVTNAKAGQSFHNYGLAFDIVLLYDKDGDGKFEEVSWDMKRDGDNDGMPDWLEVTTVLIKRGWSNGFISNGKKWDFPHFQIDFGLSWQTLLSRHNAKDFVEGTYVRI